MASDVSIVNRALTKLGADRILLLSDDSQQARVMNSMYADVRDAEVARYHWKFAIKRTTLPALVDAPIWGYQYAYPLPMDYLGLVQVDEIYVRSCMKGRAPWSVESGNILTDISAPLKLRYISRITNAGLFDPLFVETLACKLAMEGAESLTQSSSKLQAVEQQYQFALREAARRDAIENPPDDIPWGSWLDSRMNGHATVNGQSWEGFPSGTGF